MSTPLHHENASIPYAEWIDRARRQDRHAYARLYDVTYRRVYGYILARVGEPAAAEDLLQEVYLAGLQAIGRFRGHSEGELLGWLLKIAHAKLTDRLRARYRHPEITASDLPTGASADPMDAIDERLQLRQLADALAHLTAEQRDVVVSRFVLGLDLDETARVLRKSVGSVKSLQHRGLAQLARILTREGDTHA